MKKLCTVVACLFAVACCYGQQTVNGDSAATSYANSKGFWQEYQEAYPLGSASGENEVRSITVDSNLTVYIATAAGAFMKKDSETGWQPMPFAGGDNGPAYAVAVDGRGTVWVGNWKGVFAYQHNMLQQYAGTAGPVSAICIAKEGVYALGPKGVWLFNGDKFTAKNYSVAKSVRSAVSDNKGGLWVAGDVGLYHAGPKGTDYFYDTSVLLSAGLKGLAFDNAGQLWAAGLGGVSVLKDGKQKRVIRPQEGLSSIYANCVRQSPDGTMWVGTKVGLVRFYANGKHSLLFSRRWLLDDHVNDITFDKGGNAWVATAQGVSAVKKKWMTLATKQDYFYGVQMRRHMRQPCISGQCSLIVPGDTTRWQPEDDDNDGEYTGNYLAMESFRYAATGSADARGKAKKAFHFLQQLREITGGDGFFARTIVPVDWAGRVHDTNRLYNEQEKAEELVNDPRYKPVEVRWHKSADGQWLWKGDASSDEWCGHMMGYYFYYTLAADEEEKELVRKHVAALANHLIAHNFTMADVDGTHTHWAVWGPEYLNHDPEWMQDRSQNSMELLAFLKLAYYVTKDEKYQQHYLRLIKEEHYLDNMAAITKQNPAWFIYFDVTMQVYIFPILLQCENNPQLLAFYRQTADQWMAQRKGDENPLINFLYCYARNKKVELAASVDFLIDTPLDLVDWDIDHTKREDIKLVHKPVLDDLQVDELPPASIRGTVRWDKNPWGAISGNPSVEREPVFWLYPYWIGRYLKMIQ